MCCTLWEGAYKGLSGVSRTMQGYARGGDCGELEIGDLLYALEGLGTKTARQATTSTYASLVETGPCKKRHGVTYILFLRRCTGL
jgi:hypothetical protein